MSFLFSSLFVDTRAAKHVSPTPLMNHSGPTCSLHQHLSVVSSMRKNPSPMLYARQNESCSRMGGILHETTTFHSVELNQGREHFRNLFASLCSKSPETSHDQMSCGDTRNPSKSMEYRKFQSKREDIFLRSIARTKAHLAAKRGVALHIFAFSNW